MQEYISDCDVPVDSLQVCSFQLNIFIKYEATDSVLQHVRARPIYFHSNPGRIFFCTLYPAAMYNKRGCDRNDRLQCSVFEKARIFFFLWRRRLVLELAKVGGSTKWRMRER